MLNNLFFLVFLLSPILLIVGLIKPSLVIKWGQNRTRKKVIITYGLLLLISFSLFVATAPPSDTINSSEPTAQSHDQIELEDDSQEAASDDLSINSGDNGEQKPNNEKVENDKSEAKEENSQAQSEEKTDSNDSSVEGNLEVHFIDVGQADSILVKTPTGESMLIDAGNNADSDLVYSYLKTQDIEKVNVVIGTHPHEDHIGSLDTVINNFDVEKVYMPKASTTTQTFEDVLTAIKNKGLKITTPVPGNTFDLGQAKCTILAPNSSSYDDLNNYSIVIKLKYGNASFLFTGDAEDVSEKEILDKGFDVKADLLKVSHHGSESSTTESFLKAVSPKYAVISVGKDNKYGHPDNLVLQRLKDNNINVYRTDESGTIIATSDGENITLDKNASTIQINAPPVTNVSSNDEAQENTSIVDNDSTNNCNTDSSIIIQNIDKKAEIVTIKNNSSEDINLKGWKLVSVTGNQSYTFPEYILKAGASVTIASGEDAKGDLLWGKKNIWNNSKSDPGELYDNNGNLISRYDN